MTQLLTVFLLLSTITSTIAIPITTPFANSTSTTSNKSYSIAAKHNGHYSRNGTADLLRAYNKFHLTPKEPDSVLRRRQVGSVEAVPDSDNVQYLSPVSVGGQVMNLDFDTGSSDLWVFSSLLPESQRTGHDFYTPSKSTTYKNLAGYSWSISYADKSSASGIVVTDIVKIGQTTVKSQAVELATKVSDTFVSDTSDGLVGLGFKTINTVTPKQQNTFFDNAKASLKSPLFAAYLPYRADGSYDFGQLNKSRYTGDITYTAVNSSKGYWEFPSAGFKVGTTTYTSQGRTGIADTGTTLILMSDAQVKTYYDQVEGAVNDVKVVGGYTFPCGSSLPSLSVQIGPTDYATIPAKFMNFSPVDVSETTCFGSLQSVGSGSMNVYGDVFFNAFYGIFDSEGPRFGFAKSV